MHPTQNARPQHIRHHLHQPTMHPQRPPPVGINVGPQMRPPQHHHMSNVPPHGGHQQISPYIPPHQREANRLGHHQPRINSQLHHSQMQSKFRPSSGRGMGLSGSTINQPNSHGPQQAHGAQQSPGLQQSHVLQQTHTSQQSHSLQHSSQQQQQQQQQHVSEQPQHASQQQQVSHKPAEVTKQTNLQKSHQTAGPHQGILTQPSVTHQKMTQQQIGPPQQPLPPPQQSVLPQQQMPTKHSSPIKPMGIKHSQSTLSFKASQPSNAQANPIRVSHSQSSIHAHSTSSKSFQSSYKPTQPHKSAPSSHQTFSSRPNNSQPPRSSPPQKLQGKTSGPVANAAPILSPSIASNTTSDPTSKSNPSPPQPPPPTSVSTSTPTSIPPTTTPIPSPVVISATTSLHQQHKPVPNPAGSTQSPGPAIPVVQSPTPQVLQNVSTSIESRKITSDNQLKTQTTHQNSNPPVSTIQHEAQPELVCGNSRNLSTNDTLANTKEKTPMCLVNELARFNKIQHQYRLTGEQGPAHCKRFTVTLKLGEEDYTAEGLSIKKAQHAAAAEAISKTRYQHPPVKATRLKNGKPGIGNITPTVELNALLMKLGEPAVYVANPDSSQHQMLGPPASQSQNGLPIPVHSQGYVQDFSNYNRPNSNNLYPSPRFQRFPGRHFQRGFVKFGTRFPAPLNVAKELCKMTLVVGKHTFVGFGVTPQLAKHDAATKALEVLKPLAPTDGNDIQNTSVDDPNADIKSPISLVHETALKRNFTVSFEVQSERGPPHMKTFVTLCKVGDIVTEGEGNGKKISKKRAAEKMLEELKKLPPLSPAKINPKILALKTLKRKPPLLKRKAKNLVKEKPEPEVPEEVNPISKLIQIQQALKEREPVYTLIEEKGAPRRREFMIEVSAGGQVARGTGTNKKMAKKAAARNLLILMGYEMPIPADENNSQITNGTESSDNSRKVIYEDGYTSSSTQGGNVGRQIVPGLLLMQQTSKSSFTKSPESFNQQQSQTVSSSTISKEEVTSTTKPSSSSSPLPATLNRDGVRPKDQLLYLAQLLGFQAVFSDYPKGNHGEYLTIVTLSTDPPQICHGAGCDTEQSQDKASMTALQMLSELGLDNVKPKKPPEEKKIDSTIIESSKE